MQQKETLDLRQSSRLKTMTLCQTANNSNKIILSLFHPHLSFIFIFNSQHKLHIHISSTQPNVYLKLTQSFPQSLLLPLFYSLLILVLLLLFSLVSVHMREMTTNGYDQLFFYCLCLDHQNYYRISIINTSKQCLSSVQSSLSLVHSCDRASSIAEELGCTQNYCSHLI